MIKLNNQFKHLIMIKKSSILCFFIAMLAITSCTKNEIELSTLSSINEFKIAFTGVDEKDITYDLGNTITISVPFKTELSGLVPTIGISDKASVSPASGTAVDFVDGVAKPFTVTAEDGVTKKVYDVIINVRGEVGSGSQLKSYRRNDAWGDNVLTSYKYDTNSKFVNEFSVEIGSKTTTYTLVYNSKNQVIEKKSSDPEVSTVYVYNDKGQIVTSTYKEKNVLVYTYTYTYDDTSGDLVSESRLKASDNSTSKITFEYTANNVTKEDRYGQVYTATYDDKNNPFIGIYPVAYGKINSGISSVSKNNPITKTGADAAITYTYNTDDYPLTSSYTYFGAATVVKTFIYY